MAKPKRPQRLSHVTRRQASNWYEQTVIDNVRKHGWHCTSVFGCQETDSFAYTVGLFETYGQAELLIFGVPPEVAHGIFSLVAGRAAKGRPFEMGAPTEELVVGYSCVFVRVPTAAYEDYVLSASWYYGGNDFPLYQVVWPSEEGYFPWHPDAPGHYLRSQPVLGQYARGA